MAEPKRLSHLSSLDAEIIQELATFPSQAVIGGLLNGQNKGQIWELPERKGIMLIEDHSDDLFVFIAGTLNTSDIKQAISLCAFDNPMVYCIPAYHHLFLAEGWDFNLRIQLCYDDPTPQSLNKNWEIKLAFSKGRNIS